MITSFCLWNRSSTPIPSHSWTEAPGVVKCWRTSVPDSYYYALLEGVLTLRAEEPDNSHVSDPVHSDLHAPTPGEWHYNPDVSCWHFDGALRHAGIPLACKPDNLEPQHSFWCSKYTGLNASELACNNSVSGLTTLCPQACPSGGHKRRGDVWFPRHCTDQRLESGPSRPMSAAVLGLSPDSVWWLHA